MATVEEVKAKMKEIGLVSQRAARYSASGASIYAALSISKVKADKAKEILTKAFAEFPNVKIKTTPAINSYMPTPEPYYNLLVHVKTK